MNSTSVKGGLITDFKFIDTVESQTNNNKKIRSCSFYMKSFQKSIDSLVYMPNYSGKKNLEPNSWFKYVLGLMTPPE